MPFANALVRGQHFDKHRSEFSFVDEFEYEAAADMFVQTYLKDPVRECTRSNGDIVRFDRRSRNLAVVAPSGFLKTFHRPSDKFRDLGYFKWECQFIR